MKKGPVEIENDTLRSNVMSQMRIRIGIPSSTFQPDNPKTNLPSNQYVANQRIHHQNYAITILIILKRLQYLQQHFLSRLLGWILITSRLSQIFVSFEKEVNGWIDSYHLILFKFILKRHCRSSPRYTEEHFITFCIYDYVPQRLQQPGGQISIKISHECSWFVVLCTILYCSRCVKADLKTSK